MRSNLNLHRGLMLLGFTLAMVTSVELWIFVYVSDIVRLLWAVVASAADIWFTFRMLAHIERIQKAIAAKKQLDTISIPWPNPVPPRHRNIRYVTQYGPKRRA